MTYLDELTTPAINLEPVSRAPEVCDAQAVANLTMAIAGCRLVLKGLERELTRLRSQRKAYVVADDAPIFERALAAAANGFSVSPERILSKARPDHIALARWACFRLLDRAGWNYSRIGRSMKRDHTDVGYGITRLAERMEQDPKLAAQVHAVEADFTSDLGVTPQPTPNTAAS